MAAEIMFRASFDHPRAVHSSTLRSLDFGQYPSGEPLVNWKWNEGGDLHGNLYAVERIMVRPSNMNTLLAALFWVDALVERGLPVPELILPFLPGARQDRLNDEGDYLFTAKSIAKMINERHFPRVIALDPHSEVMPALIDRCVSIHADTLCPDMVEKRGWAGVVSPDAGAEKRAGAVAKRFGLPLFHAWKTRDVATGAITGFGCEPIPDKLRQDLGRLLIVDDICDGGRTFEGLADVLAWKGFLNPDLFVSHGIFSKGTTSLNQVLGQIFTTDSIIRDDLPNVYSTTFCANFL